VDAYHEVVPRLARLSSREDADRLLLKYAEAIAASSGVSPDRAMQLAVGNVGWLLGELGEDERARALEHLPEEVEHPIMGRRVERGSDEQLLTEGALWGLAGAGRVPANVRVVLRLDGETTHEGVPVDEVLASAARHAPELRWRRVEGGYEATLPVPGPDSSS
jgi:hypothetical protein